MTRLDYGQFFLSSQINYTLTYSDHALTWRHGSINRYLRDDRFTPRLVWADVVPHERGYLLFDDTVLDKRYSTRVEPARRQWSGTAKGIGVVTCVYVNPGLDRLWISDYHIFALETYSKSKLDHVDGMLNHTATHKRVGGTPLPFSMVNRPVFAGDSNL